MKIKRILAYILDMFIAGLIIIIISSVMKNNNLDNLLVEIGSLNESFLMHEVSFITYLNHYSIAFYDLEKQKLLINLITLLIMSIYFVIIPYKNKGMTLGKMVFGIRIYKKDIKINDYIVRAFTINGLGYILFSVLFIFILPSFSYFLTVSFLAFMQLALVITSFFMLLYNKGKTLEDIFSKTEVILKEKVIK